MNRKIIIIAVLACFLLGGLVYWRSVHVVVDKYPALEKRIGGLFSQFGIKEANIVKKTVKEKRLGMRRYLHVYREYKVPRSFIWKDFEDAIKKKLRWSFFNISGSGRVLTKDVESYILIINYRKYEALTLRLNKRKKAALPAITKKFKNPKVAIVMDDFGYNKNDLDTFFNIKRPVTLSILPGLKYSRQIANLATSRGYETILHLPLESYRKDVKEEVDTIKSGMPEKELLSRLSKDIASVPGLKGVSNHMGSKSTEDKQLVAAIFKYLKKNNLYFFDSLTARKSVCREVAASTGLRYARRDIFLDIPNNTRYIEKQLLELRRLAFKRGKVIAVCHDRKNTIETLAKAMPEMADEGIAFVYLSEMVK